MSGVPWLQVFKRDEGAVWATSKQQKLGSCVYNLGFGLLCVTFRRHHQLPHAVFSQLDSVCRKLQR